VSYTQTEIDLALTAGSRITRGRWEVLNRRTGHSKGILVGVQPGSSVAFGYLDDIKRTCTLSVRKDPGSDLQDGEIGWPDVDVEQDAVKPWFDLLMPDGGWMSWPKGVYILEANARAVARGGGAYITVNGFDQTVVLDRDLTDTSPFYIIAAGTVVTDEITTILGNAGIFDVNIAPSEHTLVSGRKYEQGTKITKAVNELLSAINYGSVYFDDNGAATGAPYLVPKDRVSTHTYRDDTASVLYPEMQSTIDTWDVPNQWVSVVSQTDRTPLISVFNNTSSTSPTSQPNRGFIVTKTVTDSDAVNQEVLDQQVRALAHADSQVYHELTITTLTMPTHQEAEIIKLTLSTLDIKDELFEEIGWSLCPDQNGQGMTHTLRKVINVDDA
jgi:hypothetical protein